MITLYTFGPAFGLPDPSPFVTKAELLLKMANLDYRTATGNLRKAPKGKLPYIKDEDLLVPDSTFIRLHIEQKYGVDFDHGLSAQQRGIAWAVEKLLEDHLYWALVDERWLDDANFARGPAVFFQSLPWPLRPLVQTMVRRQVRKSLWAQGLGRHSPQEINTLAVRALESVAAILGDQPYLMGDAPCGADATLCAFAMGLLCPHFDTPLRKTVEKLPNLVSYVDRMRSKYFPAS